MSASATIATTQPQNVQWRWPGPLPAPGDFVTSRNGRGYWHLRTVQVLHGDPAAPEPRLLCRASRHEGNPLVRDGVTVHPWSATGDIASQAPATPTSTVEVVRPVRVANDDEMDARARNAKARRLASEAAHPAHSMVAEWPDATDALTTKTPPMIKGRKRADPLLRMSKTCPALTKEMLDGGNKFRCLYDEATIGLSAGINFSEPMAKGSAGPKSGPGALEMRRLESQKAISGLVRRVGFGAQPLLRHLLVDCRDVASYCNDPARVDPATGRAPDRKHTMGAALFLLRIVAEHLGCMRDQRVRDQQAAMDGGD